MYGNDGNDELFGGEGDDILDGGDDHDILTGGTGGDMFNLSKGYDVITDFARSEGDTINATAINGRGGLYRTDWCYGGRY